VPWKGYDLAALAAWKAENVQAHASGDLAARKAAKLELEADLLRRLGREMADEIVTTWRRTWTNGPATDHGSM
jgi:hypothetical protein